MEGIEFDLASIPSGAADEGDFCDSVLSRFGRSTQEDHQRLCAVIGTIAQQLNEQNLPRSSVAYFGATCSSLDGLLSSADIEPQINAVSSLLTVLSMLVPRVSPAILKKREFLSGLVLKALSLSSTLSPSAVASGIKCGSHLLVVGGDRNWSDLSPLFGVLLEFIKDSRPKVRKQSHLSMRDILQSLAGTKALGPASEGIKNTFESSIEKAREGPKGAHEVLFVLDALKECIPYMSLKHTDTILNRFKELLKVRQQLVTKRITDALSVLCLYPSSNVSPGVLLDLLCSLAHSVSSTETSVDGLTFTARLLDSGMKKAYSLNRQLCVDKLPTAVNALRDILESEHDEAVYAATEAFKNILNSCVDWELIMNGVSELRANLNNEARTSPPTIIEKVCATIESLLDYRFSAVWDLAFQVVSTCFSKLGSDSAYLMRGSLKSLAEMQKLSDEDFPFRKQLHECVGSALVAMGPETFLGLLPLNLEADDLHEVNVWLFPILKQHTIGAQLSYFVETILSSMRSIKQKGKELEMKGLVHSSRNADSLVYSLWSLLPSFCNYAADTAESFKDLKSALFNALREEPNVCGVICSSLQLLIKQNKMVLEGNGSTTAEVDLPLEKAVSRYTSKVAEDNLSELRSSAPKFLSILSEVFLGTAKDDGGCLQFTIGAFSSIAERKVVGKQFKSTMTKLLEATLLSQKAENSNAMQIDSSSKEIPPHLKRAKLLDLAAALLPGLTGEQLDLMLDDVIKSILQKEAEGLIQKKAYKVLSLILKSHEEFLSSKFTEVLSLMSEVSPKCHFSARRHRLECLYFLVVHYFKDESRHTAQHVISPFLTEIIVSLKEANRKTRNRAYDILVEIAHACGDEERGGSKENLVQLFSMIAGGLAGGTPHVISAAVKGLARLAYEFVDLIPNAYYLHPSLSLLQRKNREIAKAYLGFVKVLVAKSPIDELQRNLQSLVEGLFKGEDDVRNHFKSKVKVLLEMLIKKCSLDAVKAVMPEEHMKLLTNIRKINERKDKKHAANSEDNKSGHSKATTSRFSKWNHTKIFSDSGDGESDDESDFMDDDETVTGRRSKASVNLKSKVASSRSKMLRKLSKSLPEDLSDQSEDEPLDLLDRFKTRLALKSSSGQLKRKKPDSDDEMEIDPEGRLVIYNEGDKKPKKKSNPEDEQDDRRSRAGSRTSSKKAAPAAAATQKKRKTSEMGWAYTGNEYANSKARGDVQKKDKLEPYAYWPLDRKMMSRRPEHRAAARKGMASVVKMTKSLEGKSVSTALAFKGSKSKNKKGGKKSGGKNK